MQLQRQSLGVGDLVPARPDLPFWPSAGKFSGGCGMGDLVGSTPSRPFWPASMGMGDLVSSAPGLPFWPSGKGMGDKVPTSAMYPIPQNSVLQYYGMGDLGFHYGYEYEHGRVKKEGGCGCGGTCGGCGHKHGLAGITDDFSAMFSNLTSGNFQGAWTSFMSALQEPVIGTMPLWMVGGGALLVYAFVFSGGVKHSRYSRGRRALASARAAYA